MENTIPQRVQDFLKKYPPFSLLDDATLAHVASRVVVQYHQPGEYVFREGERPGQHIYVVREGAVQLLRQEEGEAVPIEECDEGDVFGIRPLLADDDYAMSAKVIEETLIYAVNIEGFKALLENHPRIAFYLASTLATDTRRRYLQGFKGQFFLQPSDIANNDYHLMEVQSMERSKPPVMCDPSTTIQEAARKMTHQAVGSIIVIDTQRHPLGIVTDRDLRKKVVTGDHQIDEPVSHIMSSPVVTVKGNNSVADVQIEMLRHRIHHLCVTEDGTPQSRVLGVLSEHDLLVIQGNNPAVLIRETTRCQKAVELRTIRERAEDLLKKYIYQDVAISYIATIMTEVNDALITRCIQLAQAEMHQEGFGVLPAQFCWMALGSEGRGEQLLRTDQDSALVFEDVPEEDLPQTRAYFVSLAGKVTNLLYQCGFEYCPADMMASNPQWCLSLTEWKAQFSEWMASPTPKAIMFCSIFFDFRPISGTFSLPEQLTEHIFAQISDYPMFLVFLARAALETPPPLTFFRNFVVETGGGHKDEFDLKARAMMPLTDAARVLILQAKVGKVNNTFRRFEKLAEIEPRNKELYEEAAYAYELLIKYRALQGLARGDSGRYIKPSSLSKMERLNLRNSFSPIRDLQSLLNIRFQLALIR